MRDDMPQRDAFTSVEDFLVAEGDTLQRSCRDAFARSRFGTTGQPLALLSFPALTEHLGRAVAAPVPSERSRLPERVRAVLHDAVSQRGFTLAAALHECTLLRRALVRAWLRCAARPLRDEGVDTLDELVEEIAITFAEASSARKQRAFTALDRISSATVSSGTLDTFLEHLVAATRESMPRADAAAVFLVEGGSLRLRAASSRAARGPFDPDALTASGFADRVAEGRQPIAVECADGRNAGVGRIGELYGVPLLAGDRVVGVASVCSREPSGFDDDSKLLFGVMAARATDAIVEHQLKEVLAREREDFVNVVVHDLRTPLGTVLGLTTLALKHLDLSDDRLTIERLRKIRTQVDRMQRLLTDLLDVRMIASGKLAIHPQRLEHGRLVREIAEEWQDASPAHRIEVEVEEGLLVCADPGRVVQVLNNLLSNAVKYSPNGDRIRVATCARAGDVITSVEDRGVGIAPDELPCLFRRYTRAPSGAPHAAGHGIGLFTAAELVRAHGGQIWVESELGAGSTFYFSLPRWREDRDA